MSIADDVGAIFYRSLNNALAGVPERMGIKPEFDESDPERNKEIAKALGIGLDIVGAVAPTAAVLKGAAKEKAMREGTDFLLRKAAKTEMDDVAEIASKALGKRLGRASEALEEFPEEFGRAIYAPATMVPKKGSKEWADTVAAEQKRATAKLLEKRGFKGATEEEIIKDAMSSNDLIRAINKAETHAKGNVQGAINALKGVVDYSHPASIKREIKSNWRLPGYLEFMEPVGKQYSKSYGELAETLHEGALKDLEKSEGISSAIRPITAMNLKTMERIQKASGAEQELKQLIDKYISSPKEKAIAYASLNRGLPEALKYFNALSEEFPQFKNVVLQFKQRNPLEKLTRLRDVLNELDMSDEEAIALFKMNKPGIKGL